jgi:arylsulfatase
MLRGMMLSATAAGIVAPLGIPAASAEGPSRFKHFPPPVTAPPGAPNVLLIMTDDVGFGATSTFGGPVPTPAFDSLATAGLKYNEFHTTAMCSPTRAALLTGRNHHAVESGSISNVAIDEEGYTSVMPRSAGTIAQVLHEHGYDTAMLGKNHNTPVWETGPMGPFERWPNGMGFDYFYGFNAAATDQFAPELVENRNSVDPPANDPAYHLDRDLADHLIHWLSIQHAVHPEHPFFAYLAPGATHSPHQAPADWIARFKGHFDQGWDRLREETFARQKQMGIIPKDAVLTPRPASMPAWASLTETQKRVYSRMMEVAAAQLAHVDYQIGRIIDSLRASGQLDNTMVIYLQGDNGGSLESLKGSNHELQTLMGIEPTDAEIAAEIDQHGGPNAYGNYPAPWSWATNTPFQWGKQVASHLGGLRDGMVISWPKRIMQRGIRSQFHHVIDIAPTIYEAAGVTPPHTLEGVEQQPIDGVSMVYTFDHADAPSSHREQYFEMLGNRAYYKDGWMASSTPGVLPFDRSHTAVDPMTYAWELYDLRHDYSQSRDLARQQPAKLAELRADFDAAARKYHVYPLTSNIMGRLGPRTRPDPLEGHAHFSYEAGDTRYPPNSFPSMGPGWSMTAHVKVSDGAAHGPLVVQGDVQGSMGLMLEAGRVRFLYNPTGRDKERVELAAATPLAAGEHDVRVDIEPRPSGGPRAARLALTIDGQPSASAEVPVLYASHGDAYIGRPGLGALLPGQAPEPLAGARVTIVNIDTQAR